MIDAFMWANEGRNPAMAAQWIAQLPPGAATTRTIERVAIKWLVSDRGAAEAWLSGAPLSEERKLRLLRLTAR